MAGCRFGIFAFETQLISLRTALIKIKEWTDTDLDDSHHQLVMDLDRCMMCCQWLVARIDVERLQFQMTLDDKLDLASKLKQLFKTKGIQDVQKMIEQADEGIDSASYSIQHVRFDFCFAPALLTGISKKVSDQKSLLEKLQSPTVFKKMEDSTASMIVHRDADSIPSHWTGTSISSSKQSISFGFDRELFASKIYERWIRGSVKKSLRQQQGDVGTRTERDRSQAIDRNIQYDWTRLRREFRVLALGSDSRYNIMNAFKVK
jgi:guanine nucleotide-binding protein G(i) subunit alpha